MVRGLIYVHWGNIVAINLLFKLRFSYSCKQQEDNIAKAKYVCLRGTLATLIFWQFIGLVEGFVVPYKSNFSNFIASFYGR